MNDHNSKVNTSIEKKRKKRSLTENSIDPLSWNLVKFFFDNRRSEKVKLSGLDMPR